MALAPNSVCVVGRFIEKESKKLYEYSDNDEETKFEYPHKIYDDGHYYYGNVMFSRAKVVVNSTAPSFETWLMLDNSHKILHSKKE